MGLHHLRIALRALRRDAGYAALNGVGLTVALACCVLIGLFARSELSFDRFHRDADRIAFLGVESTFGQGSSQGLTTSFPAHLAAGELAGVEAATLLGQGAAEASVLQDGRALGEARALTASADFFRVFDFPAVAGDPHTALAAADGAVLSEATAERFFGGAEAALGQPLRIETWSDTLYVAVAAVVADPPRTSTVQFGAVLPVAALPADRRDPEGWGARMWRTAVRLHPGVTMDAFADQYTAASAPRLQAALDAGFDPDSFFAVPLEGFRLSEFSNAGGFLGDPTYLSLFGGAAALVLLLGLINYVNLATARAARRAREVGVRKALGAGRGAVAAQFLAEAVVLTVLAGAAALAVAALAIPTFNEGFGTDLALADLGPGFVAAVLGASVVVGLLAGAYPALGLARLDPAAVLRGASGRTGRSAATGLRRALVAVQFIVAIGLMAGTASVLRQVDHGTTVDLGYEPEGVVRVPLEPGRGPGVPWRLALETARQTPHVVAATAATSIPTATCCRFTAPIEGQPGEFIAYANLEGAAGYLDVFGIELAAGRDLREGAPETVVNEAFVEAMGWPSAGAAIGKTVSAAEEVEVVGVARDFRFASSKRAVEPAAIYEAVEPGPDAAPLPSSDYQNLVVRFAPGETAAGLAALERAWDRLDTGVAFEPDPLAESVAQQYADERRLAGVLGGFALVALIVACLGLVGLAAYTAQRRTKEIGVRRALGASVGQIVALLSREYAALLAVAAAVAVPGTVVAVRTWLEGYAFPAPLAPGLFVGAVALTAALALAVVGVQAVRAARVPPTTALRTE